MKITKLVALVVFILVLIAIFNSLTPSMLAFLEFQNKTNNNLHILWFDVERNKINKVTLASNQKRKIVVYKGGSTDMFKKKTFLVIVFDDKHDIYYQNFMTGKEIYERKVITIQKPIPTPEPSRDPTSLIETK